ncbi:hypothetical protein BO79DRAFT_212577 [Aspergillus costaricaensis CBS 115574]|uniref:Uncharacterized protein n=1 Tax=Aspergillus costaricaensis CBS 115574 TaxID=1448317 RepID=A0ACD1IUU6_9EURO|nr:hypothetical protein BO79DRAFT_212577 [Aspergillus costaricaensis CBS 115574]RAK94330.1 hypothetical protein BO79DRAFT_212577 [Aspergillus costaricaensis CBS 115574]
MGIHNTLCYNVSNCRVTAPFSCTVQLHPRMAIPFPAYLPSHCGRDIDSRNSGMSSAYLVIPAIEWNSGTLDLPEQRSAKIFLSLPERCQKEPGTVCLPGRTPIHAQSTRQSTELRGPLEGFSPTRPIVHPLDLQLISNDLWILPVVSCTPYFLAPISGVRLDPKLGSTYAPGPNVPPSR